MTYYGINLNINWKTYFASCYSDFGGLFPSRKCTEATQTLIKMSGTMAILVIIWVLLPNLLILLDILSFRILAA